MDSIIFSNSLTRSTGFIGFYQFLPEIDKDKKILIILFILSYLTKYNRIHSGKNLKISIRDVLMSTG